MDPSPSTRKNIKLVLFDLDGTFLTDEKIPLQSSLDAIDYLREKNIKLGFATGRDLKIVDENFLDYYKLREKIDYVIADNGASIKNYKTGKIKQEYFLQVDQLLKIKDHFKDLNLVYGVGEKGAYYVNGENAVTSYTRDVLKFPVKLVNFDDYLTSPKPKFLIMVPSKKQMEKVLELYKSLELDGVVGIKSSKSLFEFNHEKVNKGEGLSYLCKEMAISENEVMAFGDEMNDYQMLKVSGVSVAMKNSPDYLKLCADYITEDNNHDGIGKFIYKYFE